MTFTKLAWEKKFGMTEKNFFWRSIAAKILISNITLQILLSYCHTLLIAYLLISGEFLNLPTEFMLGDDILYSHDFSD